MMDGCVNRGSTMRAGLPARMLLCVLVMGLATAAWAEPLADEAAINAALEKAAPGDTIIVKDGVYTNLSITMTASGQEGKPITLAPETPGGVMLTGSCNITLTGRYQHVTGFWFEKNIHGSAVIFKNAQHCRLSHTAFNESGNLKSTFTHMIELGQGSTDNEIDHCYLAKNLSMGIGTRYGAVRPHIHHNWFRDIVARSRNGQEAIQLQGFQLDPATSAPIQEGDHRIWAVVEYNLFDGACGDEEIISVKSDENTIRYNTFLPHPVSNKGGLVLRAGHRNVVESNYLIGVDGGLRVSGTGHRIVNNYFLHPRVGIRLTAGGYMYGVARDCLIANNTIIDSKKAALDLGAMWGLTHPTDPTRVNNQPPTGNRIHNNVLIADDPQRTVICEGESKLEANDLRQNVIACSNPKRAERKDLPQAEGLIAVEGNPVEEKDGVAVFRDPALVAGQGVPVEGLADDVAGRPRTGPLDIGAEVQGQGAGVRRPLTPKDVGPDWMQGDYNALEKQAGLHELRELLRRYPDPAYRQQLKAVIEEPSAP